MVESQSSLLPSLGTLAASVGGVFLLMASMVAVTTAPSPLPVMKLLFTVWHGTWALVHRLHDPSGTAIFPLMMMGLRSHLNLCLWHLSHARRRDLVVLKKLTGRVSSPVDDDDMMDLGRQNMELSHNAKQ